MKVTAVDRRVAGRHSFKAPLRVHSGSRTFPNTKLKQKIFLKEEFSLRRNLCSRVGTSVEVLLRMPEDLSGESTAGWLNTGHVARLEPVKIPPARAWHRRPVRLLSDFLGLIRFSKLGETMSIPLRALIVEDSQNGCDLLSGVLCRGAYDVVDKVSYPWR